MMVRTRKGTEQDGSEKCSVCNTTAEGDLVACDKCFKWYHFACVGVDATVADRKWICSSCRLERTTTTTQQPPVSPLRQVAETVRQPTPMVKPKSTTTPTTTTRIATAAQLKESLQAEELRQLQLTVLQLHARQKVLEEAAADKDEQAMQLQQEAADRIMALEDEADFLRLEQKRKDLEAAQKIRELQSRAHETELTHLETVQRNAEERTQFFSVNYGASTSATGGKSLIRPPVNMATAPINDNETETPLAPPVTPMEPVLSDMETEAMIRRIVREINSSQGAPRSKQPSVHSNSTSDIHVEPAVTVLSTTMKRQFLTKLPEFRGDPKEWAYFEAIYNQTTAEGRFTDYDNISRLREAIKPPALDLVQPFLMYGLPASTVMDRLKKRYGRTDLIVTSMLNELNDLHRMRSMADIAQLEKLSTGLNKFVAAMQSMELNTELTNRVAVVNIANKLSVELFLAWNEFRNGRDESSLALLAAFVSEKVDQLPREYFEHSQRHRPVQQFNQFEVRRGRVMTHQIISESDEISAQPPKYCPLCKKENHFLAHCHFLMKKSPREIDDYVRAVKFCFACLKTAEHCSPYCPDKKECGIDGCTRNHHPRLHKSFTSSDGNNRNWRQSHRPANSNWRASNASHEQVSETSGSNVAQPRQVQRPTASTSSASLMYHHSPAPVLFKIVPVQVYRKDGTSIRTFAFLDDGASVTLIDRQLFDDLGLTGIKKELELKWTNDISRSESSLCGDVQVSGVSGESRHVLANVFTITNLDLPKQSLDIEALQSKHKHLRHLPIQGYTGAKPQILIGLQHAQFLNGIETLSHKPTDPIATKTELGWIVYGQETARARQVVPEVSKVSGFQLSIHQASEEDRKEQVEKPTSMKRVFQVSSMSGNASEVQLSSINQIAVKESEAHCLVNGNPLNENFIPITTNQEKEFVKYRQALMSAIQILSASNKVHGLRTMLYQMWNEYLKHENQKTSSSVTGASDVNQESAESVRETEKCKEPADMSTTHGTGELGGKNSYDRKCQTSSNVAIESSEKAEHEGVESIFISDIDEDVKLLEPREESDVDKSNLPEGGSTEDGSLSETKARKENVMTKLLRRVKNAFFARIVNGVRSSDENKKMKPDESGDAPKREAPTSSSAFKPVVINVQAHQATIPSDVRKARSVAKRTLPDDTDEKTQKTPMKKFKIRSRAKQVKKKSGKKKMHRKVKRRWNQNSSVGQSQSSSFESKPSAEQQVEAPVEKSLTGSKPLARGSERKRNSKRDTWHETRVHAHVEGPKNIKYSKPTDDWNQQKCPKTHNSLDGIVRIVDAPIPNTKDGRIAAQSVCHRLEPRL